MVRRNAGNCSWDRFLESKNGLLDHQDTISRLPESVLHHMISFLPALEKDQLRFLSRKWRQLDAQNQKTLSLKGRRLNEQELTSILRDDFHSVEFLTLRNCSGMKNLRLVNFKLKTVRLYYCGSLKNIHLKTPDLEIFCFHGPRVRPCTIDFGVCNQLRSLHLVGVAMNTMMFMDCNKSFPLLRVLTLSGCDMTGCINISSNSLQILYLLRFKNLLDVTVETQNLLYFEYSGTTIPFAKMNLPHLSSANIDLNPGHKKRDEMWFSRLIQMLNCVKHTKNLKLSTNSNKNIIMPKQLRETHVPPLDKILCVIVNTSSKSTDIVDLADAMLWICPRVKNLLCYVDGSTLGLGLVHQKLARTLENSCSFCASHSSRCWRHSVMRYTVRYTDASVAMKMTSYMRENLQNLGRNGIKHRITNLAG